MPIVEGLDGVQKMSKSLGNYVGVTERPDSMFGKLMSVPDQLIVRYLRYLTDIPPAMVHEVESEMEHRTMNPREAKAFMARAVVQLYHGEQEAKAAEEVFNAVFREHSLPADIPELTVASTDLQDGRAWLPRLLVRGGLVRSSSEALRLLAQGAIRIDGNPLGPDEQWVEPHAGMVIQAGRRRFIRLRLERG